MTDDLLQHIKYLCWGQYLSFSFKQCLYWLDTWHHQTMVLVSALSEFKREQGCCRHLLAKIYMVKVIFSYGNITLGEIGLSNIFFFNWRKNNSQQLNQNNKQQNFRKLKLKNFKVKKLKCQKPSGIWNITTVNICWKFYENSFIIFGVILHLFCVCCFSQCVHLPLLPSITLPQCLHLCLIVSVLLSNLSLTPICASQAVLCYFDSINNMTDILLTCLSPAIDSQWGQVVERLEIKCSTRK